MSTILVDTEVFFQVEKYIKEKLNYDFKKGNVTFKSQFEANHNDTFKLNEIVPSLIRQLYILNRLSYRRCYPDLKYECDTKMFEFYKLRNSNIKPFKNDSAFIKACQCILYNIDSCHISKKFIKSIKLYHNLIKEVCVAIVCKSEDYKNSTWGEYL